MRANPLLAASLAAGLLCACGEQVHRPLTMTALYENPRIAGFARANQPAPFEFPRDHGEHRDFQTEWWYVVGVVEDAEQRTFGFQFTLFRQALTPTMPAAGAWRTGQIYMGHFAIADVDAREHVAFERFARGHDRLAGVVVEPFEAYIEDWSLRSVGASFAPLTLHATAQGFSVDLTLDATKPPIPHGDDGLSWKSPTNASYYYSMPRLNTTGTITTPEATFTVEGNSWMDREWSTGILDENYRGWNWLALNLDDGHDLVFFNLVPNTAEAKIMPVGMVIGPNGERRRLAEDQWRMESTRYWKTWPVAWHLEFNDQLISIEPAFDDQLMSTSVRYWEGVVFAYTDNKRIGHGYLELTGY